jgi:hypothetical protein
MYRNRYRVENAQAKCIQNAPTEDNLEVCTDTD